MFTKAILLLSLLSIGIVQLSMTIHAAEVPLSIVTSEIVATSSVVEQPSITPSSDEAINVTNVEHKLGEATFETHDLSPWECTKPLIL